MQPQEKRLLPRIQLGQVPHGALTLQVHGQRIEIERLRDISNSGISFSVGQTVAISERISLVYADPAVKLEVFGRVAWCSHRQGTQHADASDHGGAAHAHYLMGVELLSPMMLYAVLPRA
jgi:hypothetical protein